MRVINSGDIYRIYTDTLKTYDKLPAGCYIIQFSKAEGFYIESYNNFCINEEKVYGVHTEKVDKVLKSFTKFNRSLGVILSGDKGSGKSLFARMLAIKAIDNNIPLLIVSEYIPGIASYIDSIDQEVIILFDEFDKTFAISNNNDDNNPQTEMLSLFDGISGGKKLFVVTCNNLYKLNEYLLNRPGRFHYHLRFEYPNADEIREYLTDKLDKEYHNEIDTVVAFARRVGLTYDCLRAIAFELNCGYAFNDAIEDLNIINIDNREEYNITLLYKNGFKLYTSDCKFDMFDTDETESLQSIWLEDETANHMEYVKVRFKLSDAVFEYTKGRYIISSDKISIEYDTDDEYEEHVNKVKALEIDKLILIKKAKKKLHYAI